MCVCMCVYVFVCLCVCMCVCVCVCVYVMECEAFKQGWADASMLANCYDAVWSRPLSHYFWHRRSLLRYPRSLLTSEHWSRLHSTVEEQGSGQRTEADCWGTDKNKCQHAQVCSGISVSKCYTFVKFWEQSRNARSPLLSYCFSCCLDLSCDRLFTLESWLKRNDIGCSEKTATHCANNNELQKVSESVNKPHRISLPCYLAAAKLVVNLCWCTYTEQSDSIKRTGARLWSTEHSKNGIKTQVRKLN